MWLDAEFCWYFLDNHSGQILPDDTIHNKNTSSHDEIDAVFMIIIK
jgi:hypothetical protein